MPNVIIVMSDTFRRDHVAAYGVPAPWERPGHEGEPFIHTPNLDRLATESAVFDRFYCGSYPTVPCRYDLFAGRYGFPTRGWQPLEPDDLVLSEIVRDHGKGDFAQRTPWLQPPGVSVVKLSPWRVPAGRAERHGRRPLPSPTPR